PLARAKSRADGVALTIIMNVTGADGVQPCAQVAHLPGSDAGYLIILNSAPDFAKKFLAPLSAAGDYLALFDSGGRVLSSAVKFESGADPALQEELRQGVAAFLHSGLQQAFTRREWQLDFNTYLLLDKDEGLTLGARIPAAQLLPFFGDMALFTLVMPIALFFILGLVIALDIANDRAKARELYENSFIDVLTGLLNERGMQAAVKNFLARGLADNHSLVCFDMLNFRRFNTMFGYAAGDKVLRAIAGALRSAYTHGARISGDVFVCLAPSSATLIDELDRRLHGAVREEAGGEYFDSLSFKYGVYPMQGARHSIGEAYDGALLSLRNAKQMPKQLGYIYDNELQKQAELHRQIELYMLHAISKDEFHLYVQPQFNLAENRCCGGEALVRWLSDDLGLVMPGDFIPLFEKNGFVVELDFYVLGAIFQNLREELDRGEEPAPVSVNQSRATIVFPQYLNRVEGLIRRYNVPTKYVTLEITESFLANDYAIVLSLMHRLRALGFSLAMDDFGAGYSSLNTLRELPVDALKIDKAFLSESDNSLRSRTILKNIINMSHELGVRVVCEGVETEQQLDFLKDAGCDVIQGFYYSKPIAYQDYLDIYVRAGHTRAITA
ncbi:MAG: bifunctional diguanylate cyclase/phosphodiesterase, partial [Candidatus Adiutrix sp.]|nr:bifunctional diguanylate cyclase/phosphodiesterase [Candidatus Adiutrix sp.]